MKYFLSAISITALQFVLFLGSFHTHASSLFGQKAIAIDYVRGERDVEGIKLALQLHTDYLKEFSPHLNLYFETSINFWEYGRENQHDTNFVLALSPVVKYQLSSSEEGSLYGEFGIGISLLDDTKFAGKDVSTHYQFEDRIGLVYTFGRKRIQSIAIRYLHYSNAGFKSPNPGLDFISLSYTKIL